MPFRHLNLIDKELWDAAKWRDTAFLVTPDFEGQPGIGLLFEDYESGKKIFEQWRAIFAEPEFRDVLRVSIIEGTHPNGKRGYTVHFTSEITDNPNPQQTGREEYLLTGSRWRFKETDGNNQRLDWFKESFKRHKMFFVVPLPTKITGDVTRYFTHLVGKTKIHIRDFSTVRSYDQDGTVLIG